MSYYEKSLTKTLIILAIVLFLAKVCGAENYTLDQWADAIHKAENNDNYGIISIPCVKGTECRKYCKNTVYNTLVKYRESRCKASDDDLTCLANRYCPIGSDTDNGTCKYWKKNVKWFLEKG